MRFVPRPRRVFLLVPVAAAVMLGTTACGGIDKGKLESAIKSKTNEQLAAAGSSAKVASVHCTKQNDSYHFSCAANASDGSTILTVTASCTKDGKCAWKRS